MAHKSIAERGREAIGRATRFYNLNHAVAHACRLSNPSRIVLGVSAAWFVEYWVVSQPDARLLEQCGYEIVG